MEKKTLTEYLLEQGWKEVNNHDLAKMSYIEFLEYFNGKIWRKFIK